MLDRVGVLDRIDFRGCHVTRGDSLPEFDDVDGVFLGGSYHMVDEDLPWQRNLQAWLTAYRETAKPLMGICGGHQQMATILGANVGPLGGDPMAASLPVDVTDDGRDHFLFDGLNGQPYFHFGNFEHVKAAPEGARVWQSDRKCRPWRSTTAGTGFPCNSIRKPTTRFSPVAGAGRILNI